jgi:predicted esterase
MYVSFLMGIYYQFTICISGQLVINALLSIIAVHGLGGDSFSTWTDKSSKSLWLRDFLPQSDHFKDARIMTFGYDARAFIQPFAKATTARVFTFGEALLTALNDKRVATDAESRPIIFVGHSLGGIVIKSVSMHQKLKIIDK